MTLGGTTMLVDPVGDATQYTEAGFPDLILLTDIHGDHFDVETLQAVAGPDTRLIAPEAVFAELPESLTEQTIVMANGDQRSEAAIGIRAIPMYNLPQTEDAYHVKGRGNGYLLTQADTRVYIAGDTDDIPEMRALDDIDVALLPMNPPYTMDVDVAADAVLDFAPAVAIPYHYRGQDGLNDVDEFERLVQAGNPDIEVRLLDWYPEVEQQSL
jgi:L-ascorbate metabolism protein UlaG (beta-lactamase superfamily)